MFLSTVDYKLCKSLEIPTYANVKTFVLCRSLVVFSTKKKVSSSCGILVHIGRLGFDHLKLSLMHKATSVLKMKRHFRTKEVCRMGGNTFSSYQNSVQLPVAKGSASAPNPDLLETVTSPQPCWLVCLISIKSPKLYPFQDLLFIPSLSGPGIIRSPQNSVFIPLFAV